MLRRMGDLHGHGVGRAHVAEHDYRAGRLPSPVVDGGHAVFERSAMEDALFVEKERAQVTLDSIGDAVLCTDVSGKITYLNLVAENLTGWSRQEAEGRPLAEVFRIIDAATRESCRNPMELAIQQDRAVGLAANSILIRRDGVEAAIEDSAAPIHDREGRVTGAVIVFHDVSAAKAMTVQDV